MVTQSMKDSCVSSDSPLSVNIPKERSGLCEENVPLEEESLAPLSPYLKGWRLHWIVTGWDLGPSPGFLLGSG